MHILMVNVNMVINSRKVICIKLMMSFSSTAIDHLRSNEWSGPCSLQIHQLSWKKKKSEISNNEEADLLLITFHDHIHRMRIASHILFQKSESSFE